MLPAIPLPAARRDGVLVQAHRWTQRLSLDSPVIAVSWHLLFAGRRQKLRWRQATALGLSVWAIYLVDRFLDVRAGTALASSQRHLLFRTRPQVALALMSGAVLAAAGAALALLPGTRLRGALLAAAISAYLAGVNRRWTLVHRSKETLVGIGFAAGVYLPTFATTAGPVPTSWWSFAACCVLNTHFCDRVDRGLPLRSLALPALLTTVTVWSDVTEPGRAARCSGLLLAGLALAPLPPEHARSAADLALLTPLLPCRGTL